MSPFNAVACALLLRALVIAVHSGQMFLMLGVITGALGAIAVSVRVETRSDNGGSADAEVAPVPRGDPVHRVSSAPRVRSLPVARYRLADDRRAYLLDRPHVGLGVTSRRASGSFEGRRWRSRSLR